MASCGSESGAQSARPFRARWLFGTGGRSGRGKDDYDLAPGVRDGSGGVNSDTSCLPRQAPSKPGGISANSALGLVKEVRGGWIDRTLDDSSTRAERARGPEWIAARSRKGRTGRTRGGRGTGV